MEEFVKNDIDFEACLIVVGIIYKPYASIEAQKRSEAFTAEQIRIIQEQLCKN